MKKTATRLNYQIRALDRGLDILETFTVKEPELDLGTICERANLPKSTVFKILSVLENRGYVRKNPVSGSYRIGFQAFNVGNHYLAGLTLLEVVHPFLKKMANRFPQCAAHLAILSPTETKIVYLDIISLNTFLVLVPIGSLFHTHSTALGKCLLAGLSDKELDRRLTKIEMPKLTPRTITNLQAFRAHLGLVRSQGYAMDDEETAPGSLCIGVPVRDRRGATVAAISVSHVKEALTDDVSTIIAEMRQVAEEVSQLMGYVPLSTGGR
jgi:IclR family KDG regulon transcriptional repressor